MQKRLLILSIALILILSACGPKSTPTPDPLEAQQAALELAWTFAAGTQTAMPTMTPMPTNTPVPLPTEAPILVPTATLLSTGLDAPTPAVYATSTTSAGGDPCNQPITTWEVPSVKLSMTNNVKKVENVLISLYVMTDFGECGYMGFNFTKSTSATVPQGNYTAYAWVNGTKEDFQAYTTFRLISGSYNLMVENGRLVLRAGCAPDC
jgi:hypothetical protein